MSDQRCDDAGNQGGVVHDSHADNFHGKDSRCQRRSEERGKGGTHAAHDHDVLVFVVKTEQFSQSVPDTSAQLQRRALTPGGSAEKMGDQGGDKNQRRHAQRNFVIGMDGGQNKVRAGVLFVVEKVVETDDGESSRRKQKNQPWVRSAAGCHRIHAKIKRHTHQTHQDAG